MRAVEEEGGLRARFCADGRGLVWERLVPPDEAQTRQSHQVRALGGGELRGVFESVQGRKGLFLCWILDRGCQGRLRPASVSEVFLDVSGQSRTVLARSPLC